MKASTDESGNVSSDLPVVLKVNRLESCGAEHLTKYKRQIKKHSSTTILLSSSKSQDSLDSGVYSRQKSCDSMDSLDSNESGVNGNGAENHYIGLSPSDEMIPPLPAHQYADYLRECQDIRQSIVIRNLDEKQPVSRTNSGDDQESDPEAEWLQLAGLSDLVMSPSNSMMVSSGRNAVSSRISTDSNTLSSMTVLSTLTRPQREAVLRRITSFNRAQKSKKQSKPSLKAIFPEINTSASKGINDRKPEQLTPLEKPRDLPIKSVTHLAKPDDFESATYPRRHSEAPLPKNFSSPSSPLQQNPDGSRIHMDYIRKQKKKVDSIVATNLSGGIEAVSISARSDAASWKDNKDELSLSFTDNLQKTEKAMSYSETASQENLPNFSLVRDKLGITKISDLSSIDMRKVQSLALIELSALFDLRGLELKRRKAGKYKIKENCGVFGCPLTILVECDRRQSNINDIRVPMVFSEIISFLERNSLQDEGILRKSGSAARIKLLKQDIDMRFGFNSSQDILPISKSQAWSDAHSNDVAALLKQFLRELPDPLLTTEYIDAFQSCGLIEDRKEQLQALNLLIILLNEVHRDSLKLLLKFLAQVIANEQYNKMSLNNVAMITAPNLFISGRKGKASKETTPTQDLRHAAGTSNIVRMLIKYHKLLWTVPAFMLTQVRHMNKAQMSSKKHHNQSKEKYKMKFFPGNKKDATKKQPVIRMSTQPFDYETPKGLIRIQAPDMKLTSMAVQVDNELTASTIIAKYQRQCGRMKLVDSQQDEEITNMTHALYEVGGNIHERCLDPETNMSVLLRVNPDASWLIRVRRER